MKLVYINYLAYLCTSIVRESINNINKKCTVDRTKHKHTMNINLKAIIDTKTGEVKSRGLDDYMVNYLMIQKKWNQYTSLKVVDDSNINKKCTVDRTKNTTL